MKPAIQGALLLLTLVAPLSHADEKPTAAPPGTVTLPLVDYERLIDRAARPPKKVEPPPVASVLARMDAHYRVDRDLARGALTLQGEVFRPGFNKVALLSGATILDARTESRPLPLANDGGTQTAVLGPGPFTISLDVAEAVHTDPGRASFPLPLSPAGTSRAIVEIAGDNVDVSVSGGLVTQKTSAHGATVVELALEPGIAPRVSWAVRNAPSAPQETRFLADVKTLVSLGDADLGLKVLVELNVVQGTPDHFTLPLPRGYELTGASSNSLDARDVDGVLNLSVREPGARRHQVLLGLEKSVGGESFRDSVPLLPVPGAQRETGEVAVEGGGALELTTEEGGGAVRLDVSEIQPALRTMTRESLLAAFRYQRRADEPPTLALDVKRFPDASVLAAVAEKATVTTLVTTEGRTLTEVSLLIRNHAQKFVRVSLPEKATVVSAQVGGEAVKPVIGKDGVRVPLLRTGFRATGPYTVSFVFLDAGAPFAKRGVAAMALPAMDIPVSLLEWELFLPDRYRVKNFGGSAIPSSVFGTFGTGGLQGGVDGGLMLGLAGGVPSPPSPPAVVGEDLIAAGGGFLTGRVLDPSGAALPGATVVLTGPRGSRSSTSGSQGEFSFAGLDGGTYTLATSFAGFATTTQRATLRGGQTVVLNPILKLGSVAETVTVTAEAPARSAQPKEENQGQVSPSQNVFALQRRVAGVLPVHVDVPHTGVSYLFVRPLVVDEETRVTFDYKAR